MDRRSFLKTAAVTGLAAMFFDRLPGAEAAASNAGDRVPDLVVVQGGEPAALLDAALAAMGGIAKFVKPGQNVVIKPNIGWNRTPEEAADTNPELIGHLVKLCFKAGAKSVRVFDHTCDKDWQKCYQTSGIGPAVEAAGGTMVCGNLRRSYREVDIPNGKVLPKGEICRIVQECDVFINVPILKNHGGAKLTACLKNLMGTIWNRGQMHRSGLQQAIADWAAVRKPDLNILDAYRAMQTGGPRGNRASRILDLKTLLISRDMVALDTCGAELLDIRPSAAKHIALAAAAGLGTDDLSRLNIRKISLKS